MNEHLLQSETTKIKSLCKNIKKIRVKREEWMSQIYHKIRIFLKIKMRVYLDLGEWTGRVVAQTAYSVTRVAVVEWMAPEIRVEAQALALVHVFDVLFFGFKTMRNSLQIFHCTPWSSGQLFSFYPVHT